MSKLKILPSVNFIIERSKDKLNIHEDYLKFLINSELEYFRSKIINKGLELGKDEIAGKIIKKIEKKGRFSIKNVINGTGIVLHTGFGRAPFRGEDL